MTVRPKPYCRWTLDTTNEDDVWETACGAEFQLIEGGPIENHFHYCCYCGGVLETHYPTIEEILE